MATHRLLTAGTTARNDATVPRARQDTAMSAGSRSVPAPRDAAASTASGGGTVGQAKSVTTLRTQPATTSTRAVVSCNRWGQFGPLLSTETRTGFDPLGVAK